MDLKPKMRVQFLDKAGVVIKDRLVDQYTELNSGSKLSHKGAIRLEFVATNKDDITAIKEYLDQLTGKLPLTKKATKTTNSGKEEMMEDQLQELLQEALKKGKDQEKLIKFLREYDFVFVTQEYLRDQGIIPKIKIKDKHTDKYEVLIRRLKRGKNPKVDKYDPRLVFLIKIIGDRTNKVQVYLHNEYSTTKTIEWPAKGQINFKKVEAMKFPPFMNHEEREKWRQEHRRLMDDKEAKASKFYLRWKNEITMPK